MSFKFSKRSLANLDGVHPGLVIVTHKALDAGILDFTVTAGARTLKEQEDLYAQGRTKPGKIVTWTMKSKHLPQNDGFSHAVDLHPYPINYDDLGRYAHLATLMFAAAQEYDIKIVWGGHWKKQDWPHFEIITKG